MSDHSHCGTKDDGLEALIDAVGVTHAPLAVDARIVSLVPSLTELLIDLGLSAQVVGRTTFCIHPASAVASIARVGGTKKVRLDRIEALRPTHALVNIDENDREQVDKLRRFVPNVVVTHPLGPDDNLPLYRLVGALFGRAGEARALAERYRAARERLVRATATLPPRRVLYLIWREPWMTVSEGTYVSRTLALAGLHTVAGDPAVRYPEVDVAAAAADADAVLLSSEPFPFKAKHAEEVSDLLRGRVPVLPIDGEMTSWYGSRAPAALDYLARIAHRFRGQRFSTTSGGRSSAGSKPKIRP